MNMTTTQNTKRWIWFDTNKNGRKVAYYWSTRALRAMPMKLAEAEMLIATEQAVNIGQHPLKREGR